jgi:hypothetical protein
MNSFGYNPYDRYRVRKHNRAINSLLLAALLVISMGVGYWLGKENSGYANRALRIEVSELKSRIDQDEKIITNLRADAQTAGLRYNQLKEIYEEKMGEGSFPELVNLLKLQLNKGINADRLEQAIRAARPPENCTEPKTSRLIVKTGAYSGAESQASVADGNVLIKVIGEQFINDEKKPETWFDPTLPVLVHFDLSEGRSETRKGTLPLHHSIIIDDREYRFTLSEGAASYVDITYDSCAYP